MELTIETASIKLLDELYEIEKQSFTREAFTKREIAGLLGDYNAIGLAARVNGEIAGFLIAAIDMEKGKMLSHILTLDVAPSHRRMGVARKLLEELETLLRQKGVVECRLEVKEGNAAAINLYLKLGYRKMGRLEKYYGNAHGLYLQKTLIVTE
jgi:ribosomal protein S18 acetylase RimI-like enzyme